MQTENRLLDDLARMANGALNTLSGLREEFETRVRERVERILADMDMVPREEFEAVRAMAQKARTEQEDLAAKIAELERKVAKLSDASRETEATGDPRPSGQSQPDRTLRGRRLASLWGGQVPPCSRIILLAVS